MSADDPHQLYSLVKSEKGSHTIAVAYTKPVMKTADFLKLHFINATGHDTLYVDCSKDLGERQVTVFDCRGNIVYKASCNMTIGVHSFDVPDSGMLEIK